jgi:hypothetical protein
MLGLHPIGPDPPKTLRIGMPPSRKASITYALPTGRLCSIRMNSSPSFFPPLGN